VADPFARAGTRDPDLGRRVRDRANLTALHQASAALDRQRRVFDASPVIPPDQIPTR
jgi:hypothetical protein